MNFFDTIDPQERKEALKIFPEHIVKIQAWGSDEVVKKLNKFCVVIDLKK